VRPPGFSSRHRHGYIPAERIHVHIPGHTGRIPGSYLHDKSRHLSVVAITQLENLMSQSLLTDKIKEFWIYINFFQVPPDGSSRSVLYRLRSRSLHGRLSSSSLFIVLSSIGCALSAPDGSSPRGYGWILVVNHRLKIHFFFFLLISPHCKPPSPRRGFSYLSTILFIIIFFLFFYYRLLCAEFNSFVNMFMGLAITGAR
jgi:hypothetical protein